MNISAPLASEQTDFPEEDLLRLQRMTAQRADELLRQQGGGHGNDLEIWLRAEEEVLLHFLHPAT